MSATSTTTTTTEECIMLLRVCYRDASGKQRETFRHAGNALFRAEMIAAREGVRVVIQEFSNRVWQFSTMVVPQR